MTRTASPAALANESSIVIADPASVRRSAIRAPMVAISLAIARKGYTYSPFPRSAARAYAANAATPILLRAGSSMRSFWSAIPPRRALSTVAIKMRSVSLLIYLAAYHTRVFMLMTHGRFILWIRQWRHGIHRITRHFVASRRRDRARPHYLRPLFPSLRRNLLFLIALLATDTSSEVRFRYQGLHVLGRGSRSP